ncbi:MAG: hypothetical protein QXF25_01010 [Candidatus Pacearchaeota archaeon]
MNLNFIEEDLDKIERTVFRNLNEYGKLINRLRRYWKKLVKEGLKIAKNEGRTINIREEPYITQPNSIDIFVENRGTDKEFLYDDNLLKLAKPYFPSLYRRYNQGIKRLEELKRDLHELESILENLSS